MIYFEAAELPEIYPLVTALPTQVVVDHMGRPDVSRPVEGPQFRRFVRLLEEHPNIWSKVSCPERLSQVGPPGYKDVIPFSRYLVERFPDRVLWGHGLAPSQHEVAHAGRRQARGPDSPHRPHPRLAANPVGGKPRRLYWPEEV